LVLVLAALAGPVIACAGCASSSRSAAAPDGPVATINSVCPIGADPFDNASVPPSLVRVHHGQRIGFCCDSCPKQFDKMTDTQRDHILALAKANKAE
jgi:hypothetical protein